MFFVDKRTVIDLFIARRFSIYLPIYEENLKRNILITENSIEEKSIIPTNNIHISSKIVGLKNNW